MPGRSDPMNLTDDAQSVFQIAYVIISHLKNKKGLGILQSQFIHAFSISCLIFHGPWSVSQMDSK